MHRTVRVRNTELAVTDTGDGVPLIWGHGLLGSVEQESATGVFGWASTASVARLIRYDARGHGHSADASRSDELRWPELALDMWALADELGADRPILGGTSMGCATALHAAVARPVDTRGLLLALPPTGWGSRRRQQIAYRAAAPVIRLTGPGIVAQAARFAPKRGLMRGELADLDRALTDQIGRNSRRGASIALDGASRSDLPHEDRIRELDMPALILSWDGDRTHPRSTAAKLARLLPDAEWHHATRPGDVLSWPDIVEAFVGRSTASVSPP